MKRQKTNKSKLKLIKSVDIFEKMFIKSDKQIKKTKPESKRLNEIYQLSSDKIDGINEASCKLDQEVQNSPIRKKDFQELDAFFNEIEKVYS